MCRECKCNRDCRCLCDGLNISKDYYGDPFCSVCGCTVDIKQVEQEQPPLFEAMYKVRS